MSIEHRDRDGAAYLDKISVAAVLFYGGLLMAGFRV
jgi:hypothetical protein